MNVDAADGRVATGAQFERLSRGSEGWLRMPGGGGKGAEGAVAGESTARVAELRRESAVNVVRSQVRNAAGASLGTGLDRWLSIGSMDESSLPSRYIASPSA